MKRYLFATALAFLVVVLPGRDAIRASGSSYTVEDLGTIDGLVPTVTGMNASGQISGYVNANTGLRAVRFTNGIGWEYLPGVAAYSLATAINAGGDVAGYHFVAAGFRAFRYTSAGVTTIDPLPGGSFAVGLAINASGEVTGYGNSSWGTRGWRAAPGLPPVLLPTLGGTTSMTCGINDAGQIVGSATTASNHTHAYRIEADGSVTHIVPFDGPTGTGDACAIDATGRAGGSTTSGNANRAFRFDGGTPVNLDTFASSQSSVASIANGVSVGWFFAAANGTSNAFVHTDEAGSVNLNDVIASDSGWFLGTASAVNTVGQIAGNGTLNGAPRAFRLTPAATEPPADTTAPVISEVSATPSTVWPPNGALVDVEVSVTASDDSGTAPVCSLSSLTASGPTADGSGITGPRSAQVRAVGGVTYTLTVTCTDAAGNSSSASTDVVVPPDTTAPVISHVKATPDAIWPPNGKMVQVTVAVRATDDVDSAPQCLLTSISSNGGGSADAVVTGPSTADVRARKSDDESLRVYSLHVTCADSAGNKSVGVATVVVARVSDATTALLSAQRGKHKKLR